MVKREALGKCPVCGDKLNVTRLSCPNCETTIEGSFNVCKFCQLSTEQRNFMEVFIKNRGNIKDVERELGISYPTVRSRLDAVIAALGYKVEQSDEERTAVTEKRKAVLDALAKGEISADDAVKRLKSK